VTTYVCRETTRERRRESATSIPGNDSLPSRLTGKKKILSATSLQYYDAIVRLQQQRDERNPKKKKNEKENGASTKVLITERHARAND